MYRRLSAQLAKARQEGRFPDLIDTVREVHGWLRTVPSSSGGSPVPNPGPKPKPEANKNWFGMVLDVIGVGTEPNTWGACISVSGGAVLMGTLGAALW